ncbi:MAG: PLD nuclease N-terminal domain-containing protein [Solirubrobacteraceae bacterium]
MARLFVIVPFLVVALDVFAIVDLAVIDPYRVRTLNKPVWVIIILVLPVIGALLWFLVGRERRDAAGQGRTIAPDDDPAFLRNLNTQGDRQERIRRIEQELADLDDDPPTSN